MSTINNGGPAFPHPDYLQAGEQGMSLRDYFAAKAMQGFLANQAQDYAPMTPVAMSAVTWDAWKIADAMLKAREVQP